MSRNHIDPKLSNFISTEWFFKSKEDEPPKEKEQSIYAWKEKHTDHGKLNKDTQFKGGVVTVSGSAASIFVRNGKEITDVLVEFKKDFHDYTSIFNSNKNRILAFLKAQRAFGNDLHKLASSSTTFEQVKEAIQKHAGSSKQFEGNASIAHGFHEPAHHFLGDYTTKFLDDQKGMFNGAQTPSHHGGVEVIGLTEKTSTEIMKLVTEVDAWLDEIYDIIDEHGQCWDMTDSPTRGFMDEIEDEHGLMQIMKPFIEHGMSDKDQNGGLIDILNNRVQKLSDALWQYVRVSVE